MTFSCFDLSSADNRMLPVKESIELILSQTPVAKKVDTVATQDALGRVLSKDQVALVNVPQQRNSAMDGYAICFSEPLPDQFEIVGKVFAGEAFDGEVLPGQAVVIMTGAPLPEACDTVVIKEAGSLTDNHVVFNGNIQCGQNVRQAGEDIPQGSRILSAGTKLRPQELGFLASIGVSDVEVFKPVSVAIFSSGNEVVAPGNPLPESAIYDTNRFSLHGMLKSIGCNVIDLGVIEDSERALGKALDNAAGQADVIISSGGVSMGDADFVRSALEARGEMAFWRIAMRPGRPFAFGKVSGKPFFGLPGNPVAVMVTFLQFVQPALRKMAGESGWQPLRLRARAAENIRSRVGRTDYSRGIYAMSPDQTGLEVRTTGKQGSGILTSMVLANCLIEVDEAYDQVQAGDWVTILPLADLL